MKKLIRVMKAMSDPGRVKVLKMLEEKEMCVCEIKTVLQLAQPTVSKHLKILEDAGLVESSKDKVWVNYRLADGSESKYAKTMLKNLKGWLNDHQDTVELVKIARKTKRENIFK
jgi:ArsR family transcriptional regulator